VTENLQHAAYSAFANSWSWHAYVTPNQTLVTKPNHGHQTKPWSSNKPNYKAAKSGYNVPVPFDFFIC
jgi:hypothetical protein